MSLIRRNLPCIRAYSGGLTALDSYFTGAQGATASTNGVVAAPFRIPPDFEPSAPSYLRAFIKPFSNATTDGQHVRLSLFLGNIVPGVVGGTIIVGMTWPVPAGWTIGQPQLVLIDDGSGVTFPANTFTPDTFIGLACVRLGGDAADTFDKNLWFYAGLQLQYRQRCAFCCCN
jgi:hypothetical protein